MICFVINVDNFSKAYLRFDRRHKAEATIETAAAPVRRVTNLLRTTCPYYLTIVIFTGVFQASSEDGTVSPKISWFRKLCRPLYLIDTLLVLMRRTCTVLFCVCKVSFCSRFTLCHRNLFFCYNNYNNYQRLLDSKFTLSEALDIRVYHGWMATLEAITSVIKSWGRSSICRTLQMIWDSLPRKPIDKAVKKFPKWLNTCFETKGGHLNILSDCRSCLNDVIYCVLARTFLSALNLLY